MMMPAYDELYLDDAMCALGDMLDYAVHDCCCDGDAFFAQFICSGVAAQFERGNPKFVGGMSGLELALEVFRRTTGKMPETDASGWEDKSPEYWAGWCIAYYQWYTGMRFSDIAAYGLTVSKVCSMYVLHEADVSKFVEAANQVVQQGMEDRGTNLKRIRKANGYSQKQLADVSGVALRMIQLYEQKQNDINHAQASTLLALSRPLGCAMEDLMEPCLTEEV